VSEFALQLTPAYEARGRREADNYPTPAWCVDALLDSVRVPRRPIVEPAAGAGAIVRRLLERARKVSHAIELRAECRPALEAVVAHLEPRDRPLIVINDWLQISATWSDCGGWRKHIAVGNPPYSLAEPFAAACLRVCPWVALLLPLGFLASSSRRAFWAAWPLGTLVVLSRRPSFTGDGRTDSTDYAWFIWGARRGVRWAKEM